MIWLSLRDHNLCSHELEAYIFPGTASPRVVIPSFLSIPGLIFEGYDTKRGKYRERSFYFIDLTSTKTANASLIQVPNAHPNIRPELPYGHCALSSLQIPQFPNKSLPLHCSPLAQNPPFIFQSPLLLLSLPLLLTSQRYCLR